MRFVHLVALALLCVSARAATFGTVVPLVGGAADIVLDEPRSRLYLVNTSQTRIEVYSITQRRFLSPIRTEALPLAAALSRDGRTLYVACYDGSALNVIDAESMAVTGRVSLPAKPEGLAVGRDGRVLISTIGTGANNTANVLLVYDPSATTTSSLSPVTITPPAPANPLLPAPSGRIFLASRSQLIASADGSTIIGVNIPNANSRAVFVYEVASATVLRSRTVANVSSVLSVSPDGKRFMAGLNLFDTETLEILAQQNTANSPYPFQTGTNFNVQQNQGGSVFAPDGLTLYSAFNIAPVQVPAARPNVSQLMLNDPENLLIRMGLQLPENLAGNMVISSDGANIYALSESGFVILPIGAMSQSPIATPESTVILLANDQCGITQQQRTAAIPVRNDGRGRFTLTAQVLQSTPTGPPGIGGVGGPGGGAPGGPIIIIPTPPGGGPITVPTPPVLPGGTTPGPTNPTIAGTSPSVRSSLTPDGAQLDFGFTTAPNARTRGTVSPPHTFLLQSNEAINIPPAVKVFQNFRDTEARAELIPIEVGLTANEALEDMVYDPGRQRIYIANSGMNRVEVFDIRSRSLLRPIRVGQLPRSIAMTPDGGTLYVANTGGESISIVDLEKLEQVGRVRFPPLPFNVASAVMTPSIIAASQRGALVMMNNGTIWRLVGNEVVPRPVSTVIGSATVAAPRTMASTPGGEYIMLLAGNGFVYLYDALADEFVQGRQIFTNPITGFYGPVAAGPRGQYFVANGSLLNQALTPVSNAGSVGTTPGRPEQPIVAINRPIAAVAAATGTTFVRFGQPIRANANALPTEAPVVELVDVNSGAIMRQASALEGPTSTAVGNQRVNVNGRTMAVDASGSTVYALTTSGLSIVSLDLPNLQDRPQVSQNGIVSTASYNPAIAQGGLISIFGRSLGDSEVYQSAPLPQILGGTCVTLNNQALPLIMTSTGQINAQVPPELAPGRYPLIVRSVNRKLSSLPQQVTVTKYAPAIFVMGESKEAAVFHQDGRPVSKNRPAKRDERLMLFAAGLGPTKGGRVVGGSPAPADPLATTDPVEVFFGDARYNEAEQIVEWSGLVPGMIGVYQINLYVPGHRIRGEALPVTLRIGNVNSQTTGPAVPVIAVE